MSQSNAAAPDLATQIAAHQYLVDDQTVVIIGKVPRESVVYLQGLFESYEGVGTVRTLDTERSIVCVISPTTTAADCRSIISTENEVLGWQVVECSEEIKRLLPF